MENKKVDLQIEELEERIAPDFVIHPQPADLASGSVPENLPSAGFGAPASPATDDAIPSDLYPLIEVV